MSSGKLPLFVLAIITAGVLPFSLALAAELHWFDDYLGKRTSCATELASKLPSSTRKVLERIFKVYADEGAGRVERESQVDLPIAKEIRFKRRHYAVLAVLGEGSEGRVYVVDKTGSPVVIKEFFYVEDVDSTLAKYGQGFVGPAVIERDGRRLMMEFVPCLPTSLLASEQDLVYFGLSARRAKTLAGWASSLVEDSNEVLNIFTGKLFKIDPG